MCRYIFHSIKVATLDMTKERRHLGEMKWTRAAPAEDDRLSAGFIHHAIAIESARNGDRFAVRRIGRDQSRIRSRTEALRAGDGVGRNQLHDAQAVLAVGDERKLRRVDAADLHRARVVERAAGVEHLVEARSLRIFHVDDRETFRAIRDVGVSARDVEPAGIRSRTTPFATGTRPRRGR